jgi:hypothetical protein
MWSRLSCFAFPFDLAGIETGVTREFNGARTKDVSARKEDSS